MQDHVLVLFDGVLECSDPTWAKNQYDAKNVYKLSEITSVGRGEGRTILLQIKERGTYRSVSMATKLCESCRDAVLWNRIGYFESKLDDIERRLDSI